MFVGYARPLKKSDFITHRRVRLKKRMKSKKKRRIWYRENWNKEYNHKLNN